MSSQQQAVLYLEKALHDQMELLEQSTRQFDASNRQAYARWLAQTHYFVRHSTRLLALAGAHFSYADNDLHNRFIDHQREEKGHDMMATRDLKGLGLDLADFPEYEETQAFYQSQYYWVEHVSPYAFFGYILCLECFAIRGGKRLFEQAHTAFGDKATLFAKVHTHEDEDHMEKAMAQISKMDPGHLSIITANLKLSTFLYARIYERIVREVRSEDQERVA